MFFRLLYFPKKVIFIKKIIRHFQVQARKLGVRQNKSPFCSYIDKYGHLSFSKIFRRKAPLYLEICSGNGDWSVAQAIKTPETNWIALELRHDRCYQAFSRMCLEDLSNLCVLGGDALRLLKKYFPPSSVNFVFCNHPEPYERTGDIQNEGSHLLTSSFFRHLDKILQPKGRVTITTDNLAYAKQIASTVASMSMIGKKVFHSINCDLLKIENVYGISIHVGKPNDSCGHKVQQTSYFDSFWKQGRKWQRFVIVFEKNR